jgi:hypothetical protein
MSEAALPRQKSAVQPQVLRLVLAIVVVLLPTLLTVVLLRTRLDSSPLDFVPTWSDEAIYWHEILTFKAVGFDGGYYTFEELPAAAAFTHFDAHGPVYPLILGMLARVTGWDYATSVLYNLILLSAALALFLAFCRFTAQQLVWLIVALLTFWPIYLFIPTAMQESLHQAAAIVIALLLLSRLQRGAQTPRWIDVGFVLFVVFLSLLRLTWGFLLIPYLLLAAPRRWWWAALALAGALIGGSILFYRLTGAPYPANFLSFFSRQMGFNSSISYILYLLSSFFLENTARISKGDILTIFERIQVLTLTFWSLMVLVARRTSLRKRLPRPRMSLVEAGLHLFNLGSILLVNLTIYVITDWIDYRVFAPHLLISLLLLIAFNRLRLAGVLIALNVVMALPFLQNYRDLNLRSFTVDTTQLQVFQDTISPYVRYNAEAENAWCNTVYAPRLGLELIALPPGIGFSIARSLQVTSAPFQSLYLLLDESYFDDLSARFGQLNLEALTETASGTLYRNRDADCD